MEHRRHSGPLVPCWRSSKIHAAMLDWGFSANHEMKMGWRTLLWGGSA